MRAALTLVGKLTNKAHPWNRFSSCPRDEVDQPSAMAASSPRTLGKGRILGAGKPSSPAPAVPDHVLHPGTFRSPSESSLSVNSQRSVSRSSNDEPDISAAVALQARDNIAAASASSRMVCPICNEEMVQHDCPHAQI